MNKRNIQKVLLIVPPITLERGIETKRVSPPLGPAYMAAVLESKGFEVVILDAIMEGFQQEIDAGNNRYDVGLTLEQIARRVSDFAPDVAGVSCMFSDHSRRAFDVCRMIKQINPDIVTVMGGTHATVVPEEVMSDPALDFALRGESDDTFAELVEALRDGLNIKHIDGLAYRDNGRVVVNDKKQFIEDLDALPLPARHLLDYKEYFRINQYYRRPPRRPPAENIITSRCCPANCIFCSTRAMMGRYRTRAAENVLDEMEMLIRDYSIHELYFLDDNFTFDRERAAAILDGMIERGFDLAWSTPNGVAVYALDDALLEKMRASGCYSLFFAIESADPHVLKNIMNKPVKIGRVPALVKTARALGIEAHGLFVIGLPGETREQIQRTIDFAESTGFDYVTFSIATPYPGTRLYDVCKKMGYIAEPMDYEMLKFGRGNIKTSEFNPEYLEQLRRNAWERINRRIRETKGDAE